MGFSIISTGFSAFQGVFGDWNYRQITDSRLSQNTKNATKYAVKTFRSYLLEKQYPEDFENFSKVDLDARLRSFYVELRNGKGDLYKRTSLLSLRSELGRHLIKQTTGMTLQKT